MRTISLMLSLSVLAAIRCDGSPDAARPGAVDSMAARPKAAITAPDPEAAARLRGNAEADGPQRRQLARHYQTAGFHAMAELLDRTADVREQKPWRTWSRTEQTLRECAALPPLQARPMAAELGKLIDDGAYTKAFELVSAYRRDHPSDCGLTAEWADIVRLRVMSGDADVTAEEEEMAIRTLVIAADGGWLPLGAIARSSVFINLAQYFGVKGDRSAAEAAYRIARDLADDADVPEYLRPQMIARIDEAIQRVSAR
ncbi:MAG TPA: hypothetical protein VJ276_21610 [Thermoanaerobaculia bacterium]|nr:hypothetical protein [Thermoanaerobaculia bacterium]